MGIPFIGPKESSLDELVGPDSLMVQDIDDRDAWVQAIREILKTGAAEISLMMDRYLEKCHFHWLKWLTAEQADLPI
jgi:hypothetical protein